MQNLTNVNQYSHFLQKRYITQLDIRWVLGLRSNQKIKKVTKGNQIIPFQVFNKSTLSHDKKIINTRFQTQSVQLTDKQHILRPLGDSYVNKSHMYLMKSLRSKQQKQFPILSKKQNGWISSTKFKTQKLDVQNFPFLDCIQQKNIGSIKHLLQPKKTNYQLDWQSSLRFNKKKNKKVIKQKLPQIN